ncbi:carbohydrate-binding module family 13 protein [Peniophora sp. CONT]|nr:carbohydrate-binding module family 13 protein [Peniophora sp. CONT]
MSFHGEGIYHIEHARVAVRIALASPSSDDGTPVVGWSVNEDVLHHMWLVESVLNEEDTYTIRNTVSGTYMDLTGSSAATETPIIGFRKVLPGENQKWIIKKESTGTGFWKIQNKATGTFLDLWNGGGGNGTKITGCKGSWAVDNTTSLGHQHWTFRPQSLRGDEVHRILRDSPHLRQGSQSYRSDGKYLILSEARFQEIWRTSGLQDRRWRSEIFDYEDFAFVFKAEVAKWGDNQFKADGFAILCGVMFSSGRQGRSAYNWMINSEDHTAIVFFEPQTNTFVNPPTYFGVF